MSKVLEDLALGAAVIKAREEYAACQAIERRRKELWEEAVIMTEECRQRLITLGVLPPDPTWEEIKAGIDAEQLAGNAGA